MSAPPHPTRRSVIDAVLERKVLRLAQGLRAGDAPVGVDRVLQALEALGTIRTSDLGAVRRALAATLLTSSHHRELFDRLFDGLFGSPPGPPDGAPPATGDEGAAGAEGPAAADVPPSGHEDPGDRAGAPGEPAGAGGARRDRTLGAGGRGPDAAAGAGGGERPARETRPGSTRLGGVELLALDTSVDPTVLVAGVRSLAEVSRSRPGGRSRAGSRGRVDVRSTIRRSLAVGGAFIDPVLRRRRRERPRLVLLADVSGSMGPAARLALLICHTFAREFSAIRSFAFVDAMEEVTRFFERGPSASTIDEAGAVVARAGSATSDYGAAFASLWPDHIGALTPRTTVLVLGDARANHRPPGEELLAEVRRRVERVVWLNPEPRAYWGCGDSVADLYAAHCDGMFECRRVDQLIAVVTDLATTERNAS